MSENDRTRGKDLKEQVRKSQQSKVLAADCQKKNPVNSESFSAFRNASEYIKSGMIQGLDYEKFL